MITFLASPKPFIGKALSNQVNSIRNWLALDSGIEIILYGEAEGTEKICRDFGIRYVPEIETSKFGTPLFNSIIEHAAHYGRYDIQVYINCDILLPQKFLKAIKKVRFENFLMIGQRLDLAEDIFIDLTKDDWMRDLLHLSATKKLMLHEPAGSDYFVFKRGMWSDLPNLIIGRGGYDNIIIEYCLQRGIPVVDASFSCPVFHQYHDYGHIDGAEKTIFAGEEALHNIKLSKLFVSVCDATWQLREDRLVKSWSRGEFIRALQIQAALVLRQHTLAKLFGALRSGFYHSGLRPHCPNLTDLLASYKEMKDSP